MIFFSERKELEKQYYEWIKENGIADQPNSVIAFLEIHGIINYKKAREKAGIIKLKPPTNFDKITQSVESLAVVLVDSTEEELEPNLLTYLDPINKCSTDDKGLAIRNTIEWLQKECEE